MPKVASRGPISRSYIYTTDVSHKSCMYTPDLRSMPKSYIYNPSMGLVPGYDIYVLGIL